jgi:hypothetical protein
MSVRWGRRAGARAVIADRTCERIARDSQSESMEGNVTFSHNPTPSPQPRLPASDRVSRIRSPTAAPMRGDAYRPNPAPASKVVDLRSVLRPRRSRPNSPEVAHAGRTVLPTDASGFRTLIHPRRMDASARVLPTSDQSGPVRLGGSAESKRKYRRVPSRRPPPRDLRQLRLSATQRSEPPTGLTRDQGLQSCAHQCGLLLNAG